MNIANLLTLARILSVPLIIWLIVGDYFSFAFFAFLLAGISDGLDGFIAKRFNQVTVIGAYLDPLADKLMLMSIYLALGFQHFLPLWLVILVVSRDVLILGGLLLAWMMGRPIEIEPVMISKINTVAQILLAGSALAFLGFNGSPGAVIEWAGMIVGALTLSSGGIYMRDWFRHMNNTNGG